MPFHDRFSPVNVSCSITFIVLSANLTFIFGNIGSFVMQLLCDLVQLAGRPISGGTETFGEGNLFPHVCVLSEYLNRL